MGGRSAHSQPPLHRSGPGCQNLSGLMPTWNGLQLPSVLFLLQAARVLSPLPWKGVLDPPQAHPDTADWELPLEEEAGRGRDSPGLGLPLHQPAVTPPLGVGAEVVRQLPAQLLHGAQRIALLQTNHRSLSRWSRWGARPLPPPPALRDQHGHPGLAQTCCAGSQWLPRAGGRGCRLICTLVLVSVN